ncbi:MAG: DUF2911 domain-containing protein [Bacteroidota bacterium]
MGILRKVLIGLGIVILCFGVYVVYLALTTRSHSPGEVAHYQKGDVDISVKYSRPFKKDRLIFGSVQQGALVPYGTKWRTGANEATEIKLTEAIKIQDRELKPGSYSIYTIPQEDHWVVAFNEKIGYWGAGFMKDPFDEQFDVLRARAEVIQLSEPVEQFGISLQQRSDSTVALSFAWDRVQASLDLSY